MRLPEALAIPELEATGRVEHGPLHLTWTGRSNSPLHVWMNVGPAADILGPDRIDCLLKDDGEFTIPAEVLNRLPNGFVRAEFRRENRVLAHSGSKTLLTRAASVITHQFAIGERCDRGDALEACRRYAEHTRALYDTCSTAEAPSLESLCPEYLGEACAGCTEFYECMIESTTCEPLGLTVRAGCGCP